MWDLPGPGLELMSPELAGGFLTTAPPGKSQGSVIKEEKETRYWVTPSDVCTAANQ